MYTALSTVFLAASALAIPAHLQSRNDKTCTQESTSIKEWTVNDLDYHAGYTFSTPAHQISSGYINFTLSNPALDYKPVCSAVSTRLQDFFFGDQVYNCTNPEGTAKPALTQFTYNTASGELKINQTWGCAEEGSQFWAEGGVTHKLDCSTSKYQNPNWSEGEIYSSENIKCDKVTAPAKVSSIRAAA